MQSNYIPWKGYFDLINSVDEFILFDDMQYTKRDWRNRNRIKTATGVAWLTIPVQVKDRYLQRIRDTEISNPGWRQTHWRSLVHAYSRAPYFPEYRELLEELYLGQSAGRLSDINHSFITAICGVLGITTRITWSMDYRLEGGKTERLVALCQQANASSYVSGPSARAYIDEAAFARAGITLSYFDYADYPEYPQLHPPFVHSVTVLDLLVHTGASARNFLKSF